MVILLIVVLISLKYTNNLINTFHLIFVEYHLFSLHIFNFFHLKFDSF